MEDPNLAKATPFSEDDGPFRPDEGMIFDHWDQLIAAGRSYKDARGFPVSKEQQKELTDMAKRLSQLADQQEENPQKRKSVSARKEANIAAAALHPQWLADHNFKPKYLVAFNTNSPKALNAYLAENGLEAERDNFKLVTGHKDVDGGKYQYHAEMRILDELEKEGALNSSIQDRPSNYIGISRPCCAKCGAALTVSGIGFEGGHGHAYNWDTPHAIYANPKRAQRFLGEDHKLIEFFHDDRPESVKQKVIQQALDAVAHDKLYRQSERLPTDKEVMSDFEEEELRADKKQKFNRKKLTSSQAERLQLFKQKVKDERSGWNQLTGSPHREEDLETYNDALSHVQDGEYGTFFEDGYSDEEREVAKQPKRHYEPKKEEGRPKRKAVLKKGKGFGDSFSDK